MFAYYYCNTTNVMHTRMLMTSQDYNTIDITDVKLFTIENSILSCDISNLGATITSLRVLDRDQKVRDIVLGFDNAADYLDNRFYFGSTIGRYANRISNGTFTIDGKTYTLDTNENGNTLHGGPNGFHKALWTVDSIAHNAITLSYTDPAGNNGFPGTVNTTLTLSLTDNSLVFDYRAITDEPTHISLTNHSYFNLNGEGNKDITNHTVKIYSCHYTETDENNTPTGNIVNGCNSFYDLSNGICVEYKLHKYAGMEYDINYVFEPARKPKEVCCAYSPLSGIKMEMETTEPGLQWCSGSHLLPIQGKSGRMYDKYSGFCFEPQQLPDAPNHRNFPSSLIQPGEEYTQKTVISFSTV